MTKELKEKILHYHNQKVSPEMMVKAKGVNVGISTIYYWIHHGKLGLPWGISSNHISLVSSTCDLKTCALVKLGLVS
ncbi:transposase [Streptococcus pseudopneumoniae IS7493]|nr:transposase [Streptococcus pseudopneumoniae IS7493]